jgi:hypothetical protein
MPEAIQVRLETLERFVRAADDYAAVRERGLRNERDLRELRSELAGDIEGCRGEIAAVREDVKTLTRTIMTAAITLAVSTVGIIGTLVAIFR